MSCQCSLQFTIFVVVLIVAFRASAITVFPSNTAPRAYNTENIGPAASSSQGVFKRSCPLEHSAHPNATVQFDSFDTFSGDGSLFPTSDGFLRGSLDAWAQHQHLVLRPDEVWFAILTQMNFYMNKHAENVRHLFVSHKGKETLAVDGNSWTDVLKRVGDAIQGRVKTPWLLDWIKPGFTTSTAQDNLTANVLIMGMMQNFFSYEFSIVCGLPSVTLLGEKADWQKLLAKLDQIPKFGAEPKAYAKQLRPILTRFVATFDRPDDQDIRAFWNNIVVAQAGSDTICGGPAYYISGWLLGFVYWNKEGEKQGKYNPYDSTSGFLRDNIEVRPLTLDGIEYKSMAIESMPMGYAKAPVVMRKYGGMEKFPAYVLAGNIAKRVAPGLPDGYAEALKRFNGSEVDEMLPRGKLQPTSAWVLYGPVPATDAAETEVEASEGSEVWHIVHALDRSHPERCLAGVGEQSKELFGDKGGSGAANQFNGDEQRKLW